MVTPTADSQTLTPGMSSWQSASLGTWGCGSHPWDGMVHAVFFGFISQCIVYLWSASVLHPPGFGRVSHILACPLQGVARFPSCNHVVLCIEYVVLGYGVVHHNAVGLSSPNKPLQECNLQTHIQLVVRPKQIGCEEGSQVRMSNDLPLHTLIWVSSSWLISSCPHTQLNVCL